MHSVVGGLGILMALTIAGCGEDIRSIGWNDVTGLPAGNATGALFSGQYTVTSNVKEACHCRVGSCAQLTGIPGATLQVVETDGSLEMGGPASGLNLCKGGVDQSAEFWCGGALEEVGNVQYALVKGRFALAGGQPSSMSGTQQATGAMGGFDCDIRSRFAARFVGPLTATAGAAPSPDATRGSSIGLFGIGSDNE